MAHAHTTPEGIVYLLHFDFPYHHAQHYIGWTHDLATRLKQHFTGAGARLPEVVTEACIPIRLARTWPGSRKLERSLKNQKNAWRFCPMCSKRSGHL